MSDDAARTLLRHTLATLAYRGGKALRGAPASFANFRVSERTRTPAEIVAHVCDLLEWGASMARGAQVWNPTAPTSWDETCARFFRALGDLDAALATDAPIGAAVETIFQGPIADALTHVGQLCLLRGLDGAPVRGENYAVARIVTGRVGAEQDSPRHEFA